MGVPATARASLYLYNTMEEIERFVALLREAAALPSTAWR